jgi:sugar lactone lactonase YvrE
MRDRAAKRPLMERRLKDVLPRFAVLYLPTMTCRSTVLIDRLAFPEAPRWHAGRLWLSDMVSGRVLAVDETARVESIVEVAAQPSGLGWLPDGRLLVVSMTDRRLLCLDGKTLRLHADLVQIASFHCNDMIVDAAGRAYVGNFGFDLHRGERPRIARLALVEPDGRVRVAADELWFPNGMVLTPDGRTLVVAETLADRLTAFQVEADGSLAARRVFAQLDGLAPDGICLDHEGGIWVASPTGKAVLRVLEGGAITDRIGLDRPAFACMLGGNDRRTLYVCTASTSFPDKCLRRRDGRIEWIRVPIPGAGLP